MFGGAKFDTRMFNGSATVGITLATVSVSNSRSTNLSVLDSEATLVTIAETIEP